MKPLKLKNVKSSCTPVPVWVLGRRVGSPTNNSPTGYPTIQLNFDTIYLDSFMTPAPPPPSDTYIKTRLSPVLPSDHL